MNSPPFLSSPWAEHFLKGLNILPKKVEKGNDDLESAGEEGYNRDILERNPIQDG